MPRQFFKRWMLKPEWFERNRKFRWLGSRLAQPYLWHLSRSSVSRAFLIGMFWMVMPMPLQSVPAAICAIRFRANVGLSVVLCWITNPLTMAPFLYVTYKLGASILRIPDSETEIHATTSWVMSHLRDIWAPLWVGSIVLGLALSGVSYVVVRSVWRLSVSRRWTRRKRLPSLVKSGT
jgi:uncharacterized protein (DUF2062 family)